VLSTKFLHIITNLGSFIVSRVVRRSCSDAHEILAGHAMNYTQSPGCNILIGQKTSDGEGSQGAIQTKSCHRTRASERRRPHFFVRVSKARFNKKKLPPHPSLTRATIVSYTHLPQPTSTNASHTVQDAGRRVVHAIAVVYAHSAFASEASYAIHWFIPHSTFAFGRPRFVIAELIAIL